MVSQAMPLWMALTADRFCHPPKATRSRIMTRLKVTMKEKKMANFSNASHNISERFIDLFLPEVKPPRPIITHNGDHVNESHWGL
jgi:hypothetical protein